MTRLLPSPTGRLRTRGLRALGALAQVLVLILCLAAPALADDDEDDDEEPDYVRTGLYVRGSAELALVTSKQGFVPPRPIEWEPEFGLDVAIGWRNSERLALELEFEWITSTDGIEYGSWLLGANGKFYFAEERIQPYAILGAGGMWSKRQGTLDFVDDWAFRNGLGVDWYWTEHWVLNAEAAFVWGVGDLWKNYFLDFGVGVMYRF